MNWSEMTLEQQLKEANDFFDSYNNENIIKDIEENIEKEVAELKQMQKWVMLKGKKVTKKFQPSTKEPKPFKSGSKINTVKDVIEHPILHIPAFTFEEDDSYVECRRCYEVKNESI